MGDDMLNCDNSAILRMILMAKDFMNIIRIAVPVLLILMAMLDIFKLVMSSMDKISNTWKKVGNRIIAAVVVFLVPTCINITLNVLEMGSLTASTCWVNANKEMVLALQEQEEKEANDKANAEKQATQSFNEQEKAKQLRDRKALDFSKSVTSDPNGGGVLLIAGHSFSPTCQACGDCRGRTASGYAEEEETRSLALSLKKALASEGINAVIANQVLIGNESDERMDASFFCSRGGSGNYADTFRQLDQDGFWSSFDHVIEIHFNAYNGSASGSELVVSAGKTGQITDRDNAIINTMSHYTGGLRSAKGFSGGLGDWEFFTSQKNKPMTYVEVEFYDNKLAMDSYKSKQEAMSTAVAQIMKTFVS